MATPGKKIIELIRPRDDNLRELDLASNVMLQRLNAALGRELNWVFPEETKALYVPLFEAVKEHAVQVAQDGSPVPLTLHDISEYVNALVRAVPDDAAQIQPLTEQFVNPSTRMQALANLSHQAGHQLPGVQLPPQVLAHTPLATEPPPLPVNEAPAAGAPTELVVEPPPASALPPEPLPVPPGGDSVLPDTLGEKLAGPEVPPKAEPVARPPAEAPVPPKPIEAAPAILERPAVAEPPLLEFRQLPPSPEQLRKGPLPPLPPEIPHMELPEGLPVNPESILPAHNVTGIVKSESVKSSGSGGFWSGGAYLAPQAEKAPVEKVVAQAEHCRPNGLIQCVERNLSRLPMESKLALGVSLGLLPIAAINTRRQTAKAHREHAEKAQAFSKVEEVGLGGTQTMGSHVTQSVKSAPQAVRE